ncbi:MAG: hypothetical protein CME59_14135 [Halioglobus sp.]|nr:hypothetical protein [Halioglobus sp.]
MTGLPNRRLFLEQLDAAIDQNKRLNRTVALLFLDLDRFKEVNDMHGHDLGDQLLRQVAQRLSRCVRQSDRVSHSSSGERSDVARLGGDEFTILLSGMHGHQDAALVAERILDSMNQSFELGDLEVFIGTSIGIALHTRGDLQASDLLRNADLAMYQAKNAGKNNFKFHQEAMNRDIVMRSNMTAALRKALEYNELELHYQCIVDAQTRVTCALEGLLRWRYPDAIDGVTTETVVGVAEDSGLIVPLGRWVIREACRQFRSWRDQGAKLQCVAVNVSSEQFRRAGLVEVVEDALLANGIAPHNLVIEITEGAMMSDEDRALRTLRQLKEIGVQIALDDFGTGYSSLSYVHRFPVDILKIDRSFVAGVERDEGSRAITMAVIALAHQLGLRVVGEGVESVAQQRFLIDNGCDELQGYLYSKPLSARDMTPLLVTADAASRSS